MFEIEKLLKRNSSSGGDSRRQSSKMEPTTLPVVVEGAPMLASLTPEVAAGVRQLNVDPVSVLSNSCGEHTSNTDAAAAVHCDQQQHLN